MHTSRHTPVAPHYFYQAEYGVLTAKQRGHQDEVETIHNTSFVRGTDVKIIHLNSKLPIMVVLSHSTPPTVPDERKKGGREEERSEEGRRGGKEGGGEG